MADPADNFESDGWQDAASDNVWATATWWKGDYDAAGEIAKVAHDIDPVDDCDDSLPTPDNCRYAEPVAARGGGLGNCMWHGQYDEDGTDLWECGTFADGAWAADYEGPPFPFPGGGWVDHGVYRSRSLGGSKGRAGSTPTLRDSVGVCYEDTPYDVQCLRGTSFEVTVNVSGAVGENTTQGAHVGGGDAAGPEAA